MSTDPQDPVSSRETSPTEHERAYNASLEISNTMVRLYKEQFEPAPKRL